MLFKQTRRGKIADGQNNIDSEYILTFDQRQYMEMHVRCLLVPCRKPEGTIVFVDICLSVRGSFWMIT